MLFALAPKTRTGVALYTLCLAGIVTGYCVLAYWLLETVIVNGWQTADEARVAIGLSFGLFCGIRLCVLPAALIPVAQHSSAASAAIPAVSGLCFFLIWPLAFGMAPVAEYLALAHAPTLSVSVLDVTARSTGSAFRFTDGYVGVEWQQGPFRLSSRNSETPDYWYFLAPVFPNEACARRWTQTSAPSDCPVTLIVARHSQNKDAVPDFSDSDDYSCTDEQGVSNPLCATFSAPQWLYLSERSPIPPRASEDKSTLEVCEEMIARRGWRGPEMTPEMIARRGAMGSVGDVGGVGGVGGGPNVYFGGENVCDTMWLTPGDLSASVLADKRTWAITVQAIVGVIAGLVVLAILCAFRCVISPKANAAFDEAIDAGGAAARQRTTTTTVVATTATTVELEQVGVTTVVGVPT